MREPSGTMVGTIAVIKRTETEELAFEWRIQNASWLACQLTWWEEVSPVVPFGGEEWFVYMKSTDPEYIKVLLVRGETNPQDFYVSVDIGGRDGTLKRGRERRVSPRHDGPDHDTLCSKMELRDLLSLLMPDNTLVVTCVIRTTPTTEKTMCKQLGHEIGKSEQSRGRFDVEDWECGRCWNVNWARRQRCNMCHAPKFEERTDNGLRKQVSLLKLQVEAYEGRIRKLEGIASTLEKELWDCKVRVDELEEENRTSLREKRELEEKVESLETEKLREPLYGNGKKVSENLSRNVLGKEVCGFERDGVKGAFNSKDEDSNKDREGRKSDEVTVDCDASDSFPKIASLQKFPSPSSFTSSNDFSLLNDITPFDEEGSLLCSEEVEEDGDGWALNSGTESTSCKNKDFGEDCCQQEQTEAYLISEDVHCVDEEGSCPVDSSASIVCDVHGIGVSGVNGESATGYSCCPHPRDHLKHFLPRGVDLDENANFFGHLPCIGKQDSMKDNGRRALKSGTGSGHSKGIKNCHEDGQLEVSDLYEDSPSPVSSSFDSAYIVNGDTVNCSKCELAKLDEELDAFCMDLIKRRNAEPLDSWFCEEKKDADADGGSSASWSSWAESGRFKSENSREDGQWKLFDPVPFPMLFSFPSYLDPQNIAAGDRVKDTKQALSPVPVDADLLTRNSELPYNSLCKQKGDAGKDGSRTESGSFSNKNTHEEGERKMFDPWGPCDEKRVFNEEFDQPSPLLYPSPSYDPQGMQIKEKEKTVKGTLPVSRRVVVIW